MVGATSDKVASSREKSPWLTSSAPTCHHSSWRPLNWSFLSSIHPYLDAWGVSHGWAKRKLFFLFSQTCCSTHILGNLITVHPAADILRAIFNSPSFYISIHSPDPLPYCSFCNLHHCPPALLPPKPHLGIPGRPCQHGLAQRATPLLTHGGPSSFSNEIPIPFPCTQCKETSPRPFSRPIS